MSLYFENKTITIQNYNFWIHSLVYLIALVVNSGKANFADLVSHYISSAQLRIWNVVDLG